MADDRSQVGRGAAAPNGTPQPPTPPAAPKPAPSPRTPGAWQRFLDQKTVPQRLLVALAGVVTSLTLIAGAVYAAGRALRDGDETARPSSQEAPNGRTVVQQQSPDADQFVRDLVAAARDSGTIRLDHLVYEQSGRVIFTDSDLRLVYNCRPAMGCNMARLQFPNGLENRPRVVEDDKAAVFLGQYGVTLGRGAEFGDDALDIAFVFLGA